MRPLTALAPLCLALGLALSPAASEAQYRGRGGFGGGGGGNFDPSEMLRGMDANKNGLIDPSEMSTRSRMFLGRAAERAGLDMSKPMPIDKLSAAMQQPRDDNRDGDRQRDGDRPREDRGRDGERTPPSTLPAAGNTPNSSAPNSGVVGFGAPAPAPRSTVASFGGGSLEQRFEPRVITYADRLLSEQDKNNDGYIDAIEWKAGNWSRSSPPESSDLNRDNRLSKEELCIRIAKRYAEQAGGSSASAASPSGSSSPSGSDQVKRFAESLLKQYDKNSDGRLDRDEWAAMPSQHHSADANKDNVITVDELAARLSSYASGTPSTSSAPSSGARPGTSSVSTSTGRRRFLAPAERLPSGLPSWFLEKDADQDGQVMMAEFATSWSEATAADFARCDLNADGIITSKECLKVETK